MTDWADTHGETRMTMRQFETQESENRRIRRALAKAVCPDCGTNLFTDDTLMCPSCWKSWEGER